MLSLLRYYTEYAQFDGIFQRVEQSTQSLPRFRKSAGRRNVTLSLFVRHFLFLFSFIQAVYNKSR